MDLNVSELIEKAIEALFDRGSRVRRANESFDTPLHPSSGPESQSNLPKQPWRSRGWIMEVEAWFSQALLEQSPRVSPGAFLTQVRNMRYSRVLRCEVQSAHGHKTLEPFVAFLKSASTTSGEALITKAVASHFPEIVPKVLTTRANYTFVQIGVRGSVMPTECEIMGVLADMQIRSVDCISSHRDGGVPYRGLDWHASRLPEVLQNPVIRLLEGKEFYRSLVGHVNDFQSLLAELASYNIPHALVHGDFNRGNIRAYYDAPESPQFIDWASACIGYPFLDFYRISRIEFDGIRETSALELYMKACERFECAEIIKRAVQIANLVAMSDNLHYFLEEYVSRSHVARPEDVVYVENSIKGLSSCIEACLRARKSNSEVT